jgi:formamidopyrimidine-DNA glycosylase
VPELPEVHAHAERLTDAFAGRTLERFTPLAFTALKTFNPDPSVTHGEQLDAVGRRGKLLILRFPSAAHVVHLMQGGRLKEDPKQAAKPRGGQARWRFDDGGALLLTEAGTERKAGVWIVDGNPEDHEPLDGLGPDATEVTVEDIGDGTNGQRNHIGRVDQAAMRVWGQVWRVGLHQDPVQRRHGEGVPQ